MTQTLAKELAPNIRVNGVSPGSILWPEASAEISEAEKNLCLNELPLIDKAPLKTLLIQFYF